MRVLAGIRVLEVATYGFVPSAGAALADLGADVIKIEHPVHGDPMRHIPAFGMAPGTGGLTLQFEAFNRGKRSVALDLKDPTSYEYLMRLVETADVFITNFLPAARQRARIDVDDVRARNPDIIYARGSGHGTRGTEADAGGFDVLSFWYRTGVGDAVTVPGQPAPPLPSPGFGDVLSGLSLAGGITAALLGRERTGRPTVVDVSLMSVGMWAMQVGLIASDQVDHETMRGPDRQIPGNPLVRQYLTSDGRLIALCMLEPDRYWPGLCRLLGRPELVDDRRFIDAAARREHDAECVAELAAEFGRRTLHECRQLLARQDGQWGVAQHEDEIVVDPQAMANDYVAIIDDYGDGITQRVIPVPYQFDEQPLRLTRAPELGEHTDEVLSALPEHNDK
jgi:crotonobetainyl-CoA:carnitine CoA-transferase CaiB-like acyl-CoA transferase